MFDFSRIRCSISSESAIRHNHNTTDNTVTKKSGKARKRQELRPRLSPTYLAWESRLGLVFLKYISDAFAELHERLDGERVKGADPEDPDEYRAESVFWVPPEARWAHLRAQARQPTIGQLVDAAMQGIERGNLILKDVLPKNYARPALIKERLGRLIDVISSIQVGGKEARSKDVLGRV